MSEYDDVLLLRNKKDKLRHGYLVFGVVFNLVPRILLFFVYPHSQLVVKFVCTLPTSDLTFEI